MCTSLDGIYLVPYKLHIMISVCVCVCGGSHNWLSHEVCFQSHPWLVCSLCVCLCVQVYALVTSEQSPMTEIPGQEQDGSEARQPLERDPLFVAPSEDIFHLQLFSPASWEAVPNTK